MHRLPLECGKTLIHRIFAAIVRNIRTILATGVLACTHTGYAATPARAQPADFGPNVFLFDPSMSGTAIQAKLDSVFKIQERSEFGLEHFAFLFQPGSYSVDANIGFNTEIAGLGLQPDDVKIAGHVHAEADWMHDNGTDNFWRSASNMAVVPPDGSDRWAVSQASPFRRMHIEGNLQLDPRNHGWSSGGFAADCKVDGGVSSGSQQQYCCRDDEFGKWSGSVWNMVFVGVLGAPQQHFPNPSHTVAQAAPVIREKPFLYLDGNGAWQVFLPALRSNAAGTSWSGKQDGVSIPLKDKFLIVKPGTTAAQMNAALDAGKNLLITPGVYHLDHPLDITHPDTVVLGLGMATLVADGGSALIKVADVDGVRLAGLLLDAGETNSALLAEIGPPASKLTHAANPTSLHDVFARIGGGHPGKATLTMVINSNDVIVDHTWLWRADHGKAVGWGDNTAETGLVVNGGNVTAYGLFVEHYQKYNVIWNGDNGRTYMFQNELPYDPPTQEAWMNGAHNGYAAYKVADSVTTHEAWGLGSYCYFNKNPAIMEDHSFEVPDKPGVKLHDLLTVSLGGKGTITHIINSAGGTSAGPRTVPAYLQAYP